MLLIDNQTVAKILDIKGCMEALEIGYRDLIKERAVYRGRYDLFVPNDDPKLMYRWGTMEGASRSFETFAIRMKSDMLEWPEGKTVEQRRIPHLGPARRKERDGETGRTGAGTAENNCGP